MSILIDISMPPVQQVLDLLLKDKTTKQNIIFATDAYSSLGARFTDKSQITRDALEQFELQPRIEKNIEEQLTRTRKRAEVFTPAWICNKMNNYADEVWFKRKGVFNIENPDNTWTTTVEPVRFIKKKPWRHYVDSRRLEITCGEAPYLVSRYDMATGEQIPIKDRIGILDRKLRVVNENTETKEDWIKWATRAIQASYGFEYQGDSLLIARINVLMTFYEYYKDRWNEEPTEKLLKEIANVISWNLWQMDGLKDTVPLGMPEEEFHQITMFEFTGEATPEETAPYCKIRNWRADRTIEYKTFKSGVEKKEK